METSVALQQPFEYSILVILPGIVLLVLSLVLFVRTVRNIKRRTGKNHVIPEYRPAPYTQVIDARNRAILQIRQIISDFQAGAITKRAGYQRLSLVIRSFVHDTTGINVEVRTLEEIKTLGMPGLNALIEEYYTPEFAEDERSDKSGLWTSCNKTIGVIESWR